MSDILYGVSTKGQDGKRVRHVFQNLPWRTRNRKDALQKAAEFASIDEARITVVTIKLKPAPK